ncbi:hypothetical protein WJ968_05260 [Achromobacter xylosoxidans]
MDAATFVPSQAERDAIEDILWPLRKRQFASLAEFRAFSMRWCAPTCARPRRAIWAVR